MRAIKKVAILGANGAMGSSCGAIFASAGIPCLFFARTMEKAEAGIRQAVNAVRSNVLKHYIVPKTYDELETELPDCDWIFEALAEDISIKRDFFTRIDGVRKPGTIVSSVSSGLSISKMVEDTSPDFKAHSIGAHYFNPPTKLPANELIFHPANSPAFKNSIRQFCAHTLRRINIETHDAPGFAGNRIGFQFLNSAGIAAQEAGATTIDYLLGPYTGRAMAPLATIDLVGLDVHKAIVENLKITTNDTMNASFKIPDYMINMVDRGMLGNKAHKQGGFYLNGERDSRLTVNPSTLQHEPIHTETLEFVEQVKDLVHNGSYRKAITCLFSAGGKDADTVRRFILNYISYSFSLIGVATPESEGIHGIDRVMAYGFAWLPPSGWVDLIGGPKESMIQMDHAGILVPDQLKRQAEARICRLPEISKYLSGR